MFGKTYLINNEGDTHTNVYNKMLPHDTADAARLYKEMDSKVRSEIFREMVYNIKPFNMDVSVLQTREPLSFTDSIMVSFIIDGSQHSFTIECAAKDLTDSNIEGIVMDKVVKSIASHLMPKIFLRKQNSRFV